MSRRQVTLLSDRPSFLMYFIADVTSRTPSSHSRRRVELNQEEKDGQRLAMLV